MNATNFVKTSDPYRAIGVGEISLIEKWLQTYSINKDDYKINDDFSIDVYGDVNLINKKLEQLPVYIKFNKINGGFYAGGNRWKSLKGFPSEVNGDLQIESPSTNTLIYNKKKFKENYVKKIIKVNGNIYI